MPRRSARSAAAGGSKIKKAKQEDVTIGDVCVRFEWEGDGGTWMQYSKTLNKKIAEAYIAKKKQVEIEVATGVKMQILFDTSVQKNKRTGYERCIRVAMKDNDGDFKVFEWEGDDKAFHPYNTETSLELQDCVNKGTTLLSLGPHLIHLVKKTQTNPATKKCRKIRHLAQASESPDKEEEVEEVKEEVKEEEEEEEVKPKSGRAKSGKSGKSKGQNGEAKSTVKTVIVKKGGAPVDTYCPIASKCSVYDKNKVIWDCMLNQTNISNNNNKFYLIQVLKTDGKEEFHCWQRWGRVGYDGQNNLVPCGTDLESAIKVFEKKFRDKTGNNWHDRDSFVKHGGKYDLIQMDYSTEGKESMDVDEVSEDGDKKKEDEKVPDSKLDQRLQDFVKLICDIKSMEDEIVEMKYDTKKAPLGKLTKEQVKAGYLALKEIESLINDGDFGNNLREACSDFYTRIPHVFGMQVPPLIRTSQDVRKKLQLLEALEDIEIAIKLLKGGDMSENPVDRNYHQLKCQLDPVDKKSDTFKLIENYLLETHATTHKMYKMELEELFCVEKDGEASRFKDYGNRMLLWHGSRLTNWAGILGQGLRIAPPEAPVTGYMFGKGVYFADMSSKSANYCFATKTRSTGVMVLCDVSLGTINEKLHADPKAATLPSGKHSVKGLGIKGPLEKTHVTMPDGLVVPVGKESDTPVKTGGAGYSLNYNEFIVYDTCQIKMKYLLKVNFKFR